MKKIMTLTVMMVLALAVGSAYADNGITIFSALPAVYDNAPLGTVEMSAPYEGSGAGGLREEVAVIPEPDNKITIFSVLPATFDSLAMEPATMLNYEESSAPGGLHEEEALRVDNGITIFHPVSYDSVPTGW